MEAWHENRPAGPGKPLPWLSLPFCAGSRPLANAVITTSETAAAAAGPIFDLASDWPAFFRMSLARIVEASLKCSLDKREQCSSWGTRPLTPSQVAYAAKDAAVCVAVFQSVCFSEALDKSLSSAELADALDDRSMAAAQSNRVVEDGRHGGVKTSRKPGMPGIVARSNQKPFDGRGGEFLGLRDARPLDW